jgi:hypothetical protein
MMTRLDKIKYYIMSNEHPWVAFGLLYLAVIAGVTLVWGLT